MSVTNEALLEHLIAGNDLDPHLVRELMERILSSAMPPAQVAAALSLLRAKRESAVEVSESAQVVLTKASAIESPDYLFADVVGTGGDGHNTINVSTLASLTAASVGLPVAKHGNSSVSSKCGSADLLMEWGVDIKVSPEVSRACLDNHKFCFLFAPLYHPTFQSVKELRKELKIKTIFNILGPLVNPIAPPIMLIGVYDPRLLRPFAEALKHLGRKRALIVHGSGLDEIALHGPTHAVLMDHGALEELVIEPSSLGLATYPISAVQGASPTENARLSERILAGTADEAMLAMVSATAGALLWLSEKAKNLREGVALARTALSEGRALQTLEKVRSFSHGTR